MRNILTVLISAALATTVASAADVEGITVEYLDAGTPAYKQARTAVSRISFSEGNVTIVPKSGDAQTVGAISEVARISFGTIDSEEQTVTAVTAEKSALEVKAYPNPVADHLHISGLPEGAQVRIYAADGRLVHTGTQADIDFTAQPRGVYLLVVKDVIVKIVKQ